MHRIRSNWNINSNYSLEIYKLLTRNLIYYRFTLFISPLKIEEILVICILIFLNFLKFFLEMILS